MSGGRIGVVGLGAIGALTLRELTRRGHAVVGIDTAAPGHDEAGYGGGTRQSRAATQHAHSSWHVGLVHDSAVTWAELGERAGDPVYLPTGQLAVAPVGDPELDALTAGLRAAGLAHEQLTPAQVRERFPAHRPAEDETGLYVPAAGVLRSNLAVATAAAQAVADGARIVTGHVEGVTVRGGSAVVSVAGREHEFDHVVLACGAWTPRLVPELARVVAPRVVPSVWLPGTPADRFTPAMFPPGFRRRADGTGFTFLPAVGGAPAKFVVWNPRRDIARDPADLSSTAGAAELVEATTAVVTATMDGITPSAHRVARYADGFTPDRWPVVETIDERLTVLTGFSGGGFAIAPAMARIAADTATGARPDAVVDTMRLARFTDTRPDTPTTEEPADAAVR